jgi:predicted GIY-YIG superfamily endonuclease
MKPNDWEYCQNNSNLILASGLKLLTKIPKSSFSDLYSNEYGNYLISDKSNKWNYIGETKNLSNRLKQHSKERTSTFYKNFKKFEKEFLNYPKGLEINDFQIQTVKTNLGRKEIEEFGIVNIPAILNKFQKEKRNKYSGRIELEIWNRVQTDYLPLLEQGEKQIMKSADYNWFSAKINSTSGIYWVEHKSKGLIYIGESSNIVDRYYTHSGTTYFSALRRHIGENILGFYLQMRNGKKRYFSETEDIKVTDFLKRCTIKTLAVNIGRFELEEYLIRKHKPLLNRKENK